MATRVKAATKTERDSGGRFVQGNRAGAGPGVGRGRPPKEINAAADALVQDRLEWALKILRSKAKKVTAKQRQQAHMIAVACISRRVTTRAESEVTVLTALQREKLEKLGEELSADQVVVLREALGPLADDVSR